MMVSVSEIVSEIKLKIQFQDMMKCNEKKGNSRWVQFQDMKKCNEKKGNSRWFQFQKLYLKSN